MEGVPASIDAVGMWDAVVHVDDIDGYKGVVVEVVCVVECVYVCKYSGWCPYNSGPYNRGGLGG